MEQLKKMNPDLFVKRDLVRPPAVLIKNVSRADAEVPPKLIEYLKIRNKQSSQKYASKHVAFCFLTYGSIMHPDAWDPYFLIGNAYIHPKNPEMVEDKYKKFVIPTLIDTKWASDSIVDATILLLKEAFKKTTNEWFILCSEDSYPLMQASQFLTSINSNELSIFNVVDEKINKTSQWWALRRTDVELLLEHEVDFNDVFNSIHRIAKRSPSAPDELFFLNALKTFNPIYQYNNKLIHYVKWIPNVVSKHPVIFNRLTEQDADYIQTNNCLFIRKTFPTFQNVIADKSKVCIVLCIGTSSIQEYGDFLNYAKNKARIFVLSFLDRVDNADLQTKCVQMCFSVWNNAEIAVETLYNGFINKYDKVFVLLEKFDYRQIQYPTNNNNEWSFLYTQPENVYKLPPLSLKESSIAESSVSSSSTSDSSTSESSESSSTESSTPSSSSSSTPSPPTKPSTTEPESSESSSSTIESSTPSSSSSSSSSSTPSSSSSSSSSSTPSSSSSSTSSLTQVVVVKPKTKKIANVAPPTRVPQISTRKIIVTDKSISHISANRYVKFGSVPVNNRMHPHKDMRMIAHPMYMNNRKIFINLTNKMFEGYREIGLDVNQNLKCEDLSKSNSDVSLLTHQRLISDYMKLITPYRGLLLYHGLGAGKTCSSIAIAEGFKTDKQIIVMTPASLNPNYMEELKKCGDEYYKKQQYWEWIEVVNNNSLRDTLSSILQLPKQYIELNSGAWVVDITKPSNYDSLKRPNENDSHINANQTNLNNQLNEMIINKYSFINYNGISTVKYNELCKAGNPFDHKVVIIDEAHNLVSRIVNQLNVIYETKQQSKLRTRKLVPMAINIYKDLMSATDARIVLLSGTPIINYPNEIAVLFNILRGSIKTFKFTLKSTKPITLDILKSHFSQLTMLDYIEYNPRTFLLTVTTNPFGFESDGRGGVIFNPNAEHLGDRQFPERVIEILKTKNIGVDEKSMNVYTALPDALEEFMKEFIQSQENNMYEFNNPMKFKKRILGLTSYFRSAQEELLPRYNKETDFNIVNVPMSDFQFAQYEVERSEERKKENKRKKPAQVVNADDTQSDSSSTFKIYSRLLCNFATPAGFERPKPPSKKRDVVELPDDVDEVLDLDASIAHEGVAPDEYKQALRQFIDDITRDARNITGDGLAANSPKLMTAMHNIQSPENDGLHLVYSQFRTYEGIEIFSRILSANGFARFKIKSVSRRWVIDIAPQDMDKPKYALYTGTEDAEEREILRNIYNGSWKNVPKSISDVLVPKSDTNNMGQHIKVLMITAAGSEGINLFNTRFVHLIDPYWNNVRLEQVVGRARRICSHQSLPIEKQTVSVFLYLSVLTESQYSSSKELMHYDVSKINDKRYMSSDETLYEIACIKEMLNTKILHAVKEASIDCATHVSSSSKENLTCLSFGQLAVNPNAFSYLPDIKNDPSDEVSKQNVEMIALTDFKKMARRVDGVEFVKQISTGKKYTVESFTRAQRTNNLRDLILFTE